MRKSSTARDENNGHRKNPYEPGLFARRKKSDCHLRAIKMSASSTARIRRKPRRGVASAKPKIIFHRPRFGSIALTMNRSKRANRSLADSRRDAIARAARTVDEHPNSAADERCASEGRLMPV
jgi:hypothetical protein